MTQAQFIQDCDSLDYTPSSAVTGGDVVVIGNRIGIARTDIAADRQGALATVGVYDFVKVTGAITDGDEIFWDDDGDPVDGTAGTGAATTDASKGPRIGCAVADAASGDATVRAELSQPILQAAAVADLGQDVSVTFVEAEVQAISDKVDELLAALRLSGQLAT